MNCSTIHIQKTMRYWEKHPLSGSIKKIAIVLHGYGQLAEFFIRKFKDTEFDDTLIICPEGTHRFYLNGTDGRVGASWMTKEWREQDILENNLALEKLVQELSVNYSCDQFSVVGFSQGGATAARWVSQSALNCNHFILWASVFPPDLKEKNTSIIAKTKLFVWGKKDPYFNQENWNSLSQEHSYSGFETHYFDGKHDIDPKELAQILNK